MSYYTYIARCNDNSLYTGYCVNITQREKVHNEGKGAKYTRQRTPVKIIYFEEFDSRSAAMIREIQIKGWTKIQKENLIKSDHSTKV
jgi:putative endonuclease